jgi:hypothetical protein
MFQFFDHFFLRQRVDSQIWMFATPVLGIQLSPMIIGCHDMQEFRPAKKRVDVSADWEVPLKAEETTDMTTDETTTHSAMPPKNGGQAAGYSHLTNPAQDAGQVIGYSHATKLPDEELSTGHSKEGCQMLGYAA